MSASPLAARAPAWMIQGVSDAVLNLWPQGLLILLGLGFVAYLRVVLQGADDLEPPDRSLARTMEEEKERQARRAERTARAPRRVTAAKPPPPPVLRPPAGAVASGTASVSQAARKQEGLLRVLRNGPDFQRPAAAKALSVPFAGTADPTIVKALTDTVNDPKVGTAGRAEAYCALRTIVGDELSWEQEVTVRQAFPKGVDLDWVERARADAEGGATE